MLDEIYESIGHADTDSLMTLAVDPLVVYGPRKADVHATRADALVALKAVVDRQKRPVKSGDLAVVPSPGGRSAWAFDVIDVGGQALAVTAILSNAGDVWQVSAADVAATPAMKSVRDEVKHDAVVPPGMSGIAKIDPSAKPAVDKLTKGLADQAILGGDLGSRSDAVYAGPGAGEVVHGKAELKKLFEKRSEANVREVAAGDTTAATTADGQLAWVTLPVVRFEDEVDPIPLRVFAIFEKHDADWRLIALQESVALDAPGTGAAFKKIVRPAAPAPAAAPAPPPPPADKKVTAESTTTTATDETPPPKKHHKHKHKHHHKKKPPPTDDDSNAN